ncbi:MAG: bifunctional UDP-4-keto-pentose/UDP-xylose synthase [Fretibacterium sp.]|nr:bifunctional UDP-4-keto-pentose/UDP-xylose synthase [Fretibacterium sp.]
MKIFLLGAGGFIGSHLTEKILNESGHEVVAFDLNGESLAPFMGRERFSFHQGDIFKDTEWIEDQVAQCDVVLPFAGVAKPAYYLSKPLWTFELDFEQNLKVVRMCAKHKKRVVFPSTSEVYGLSSDGVLLEDESPLIVGPIGKMRWIYSCGKQMMDRVITAYGQEQGLRYTLFRPFNWIGPRLDTLEDAREHRARSITQIVYDILNRGEVTLVAGGEQRRSFTWIGDGTDALMRIIENEGGRADGQIFNIGNPANNASVRELAETIISVMQEMPCFAAKVKDVKLVSIPSERYYSNGYDDMQNRVPSIEKMKKLLGWTPRTGLRDAIRMTLDNLR